MDFPSSFLLESTEGVQLHLLLFSPLSSTLFFETLGLYQLCSKLSTLSPPIEITWVLSRIWRSRSPSLNLIRICDLEDEEALSRWRVVPGRGDKTDWWRRNWKSPEGEKASPEVLDSRADVQQMALALAWGVCRLPGHVVCVITVPHVPKGSRLGLMLCCHYRDFVNTVWTSRGLCLFILYWVPQIMQPVLLGCEIQSCHLLAR